MNEAVRAGRPLGYEVASWPRRRAGKAVKRLVPALGRLGLWESLLAPLKAQVQVRLAQPLQGAAQYAVKEWTARGRAR